MTVMLLMFMRRLNIVFYNWCDSLQLFNLTVILICVYLMTGGAEHYVMNIFSACGTSFNKYLYSGILPILKSDYFLFCYWDFCSICILYINLLLFISMFSPLVAVSQCLNNSGFMRNSFCFISNRLPHKRTLSKSYMEAPSLTVHMLVRFLDTGYGRGPDNTLIYVVPDMTSLGIETRNSRKRWS